MDFLKSPDGAQIIYRIRQQTDYGRYSDSLYFTLEEWEKLTQDDLDVLVKARVDNWIAAVTAPPPKPVIPTQEDLEAEKFRMEQAVRDVEAKFQEWYPPK